MTHWMNDDEWNTRRQMEADHQGKSRAEDGPSGRPPDQQQTEPKGSPLLPPTEPKGSRCCRPQSQRAVPCYRPQSQRVDPCCRPQSQRAVPWCRPQSQRAVPWCRPQSQRADLDVANGAKGQSLAVAHRAKGRSLAVALRAKGRSLVVAHRAKRKSLAVTHRAKGQTLAVAHRAKEQSLAITHRAKGQTLMSPTEPKGGPLLSPTEPKGGPLMSPTEPKGRPWCRPQNQRADPCCRPQSQRADPCCRSRYLTPRRGLTDSMMITMNGTCSVNVLQMVCLRASPVDTLISCPRQTDGQADNSADRPSSKTSPKNKGFRKRALPEEGNVRGLQKSSSVKFVLMEPVVKLVVSSGSLVYQFNPFAFVIIIIAFKGAIRDFLQSPHSAVSNTYAQVARAQSCANPMQHIGRWSRASVMLRATWYEGTPQLLSLTESKSHLF